MHPEILTPQQLRTLDSPKCFGDYPTLSPSAQAENDCHNCKFQKVCSMTTKPALDVQVGGGHYKGMKIQHVEFVHANQIPYVEANAIKYICRHRQKNGRQDIEKAIHYLQILLELEYPDKPKVEVRPFNS